MTTEVSARRGQTRDRLIEAAVGVFADKGVLGASVEEICEAAGFTRGAFYSNFDSKDALCIAVLEKQADADLDAARRAIASLAPLGVDADTIVDQAIAAFLATQRSDRTRVLAAAELRLYAAREPAIREAYRELVARTTRVFAPLILDAAASVGYEVVVPPGEALEVLHAVYEHGAVSALIANQNPAGESRQAGLAAVLRSMLRRVEAS